MDWVVKVVAGLKAGSPDAVISAARRDFQWRIACF
jgi:hypothetical protein